MTHRRTELVNRNGMRIALLGGLIVAMGAVSGCGKKQEQQQAVATPRSSAPAAPRWSIEDLEMDPRVQFPDRAKPSSEALAQAVASFASSLVQGDEKAFGDLLSPDGQAVLKVLDDSGDWKPATEDLKAVRICRIDEGSGAPVLALGVEDGIDATLLAWRIEDKGGAYEFTPMAIETARAERVAMLDDTPLVEPIFDSGGAVEAPVIINPPKEDHHGKGSGRSSSPGRGPRSTPPSGPTPLAPPN